METQTITTIITIAAAVILIGWDIYAVWKDGGKATISYIIANAGRRNRMIPFVFGVLMGHFFWPITSLCTP